MDDMELYEDLLAEYHLDVGFNVYINGEARFFDSELNTLIRSMENKHAEDVVVIKDVKQRDDGTRYDNEVVWNNDTL